MRGVRRNMSWLELGSKITKLDLLHPAIQSVARGALRRGLKWHAYRMVEVNKYGGRQQYGQFLWVPKANLIGHLEVAPPGSGGFIGHGPKPVPHALRWERPHPLARNIKEVWNAHQWGTYQKGRIRRYGGSLSSGPEFAHWLEAREAAEREGRTIPPYREWSKEMSEPFHSVWWREGWTSKGRPPARNPRRRARRNAGWPKHPFLRYGTPVVATQPIRWKDVRIPKGARGKVLRMLDGGEGVHVDFGRYGTMQCLAYEVRPVGGHAARNPRRR